MLLKIGAQVRDFLNILERFLLKSLICFGLLATLNVFRYIPVSYPSSLISSLEFIKLS